jgi:hypothetical protein
MVQALLAGRKTQTRRLCKDQPPAGVTILRKTIRPFGKEPFHAFERRTKFGNFGGEVPVKISRGDRLWVRESLSVDYEEGESYDPMGGVRESACGVSYGLARGPSADREYVEYPDGATEPPMRGIPSIHMPKWASRLTLLVTDVRIERLNDCSESDARAEGVLQLESIDKDGRRHFTVPGHEAPIDEPTAKMAYAILWDWINGAGEWHKNPWVVAYTFSVVRQNIDQIGGAA